MADELLVASDDAGALAERLATFLSNPERRAAVAIRLQARAREVFSWKATGERLSQTVAALVDAGSSVQTFQRANAP
jgi:glycosyltransferase involved in cell wall biosynthesis